MKIIDASGEIFEGMWNYGPPFPEFKLRDIELPEWLKYKSYSQSFEGFHMLTGTYIVAPSHGLGPKNSYSLESVPIQKLYSIDAFVLRLDFEKLAKEGSNPYISCEDLKSAGIEEIPENSSILLAAGYGRHWSDPDYLKNYYFIKKDAFDYILSKKPFLLGLDSPSMDNLNNPQGLSGYFYNHNVLLLAPLVNLEEIKSFKVKLTVCPLKFKKTTGSPCRVIITEE